MSGSGDTGRQGANGPGEKVGKRTTWALYAYLLVDGTGRSLLVSSTLHAVDDKQSASVWGFGATAIAGRLATWTAMPAPTRPPTVAAAA